MKRILCLLFCLFLLTGCTDPSQNPGPTPPSSVPGSTPSSLPEEPPHDPTQEPPVDTGPSWQQGYLDELHALFAEHGKYVVPADNDILSGVVYARLLDFNGDGVRELVVVFNGTVRLYTWENGVEQLYEGTVGARYGQTDVSYTFHINAISSTPTITLFHSENEWCEEAITIISLDSEGQVVQTELYAATDGTNPAPVREFLAEHRINGQSVEQTVYEAARSAALDDSVQVDTYFGEFPASPDTLEILLTILEAGAGQAGAYLLPDSDAAYLTADELSALTARELRIARNEIYARHGRCFDAPDLKAYFTAQSWYSPTYTPQEFDMLAADLANKYELANLQLILTVERSGNYVQNAAPLTLEEALAIAEAYWDYREGMLDPETGYLQAISVEDQLEIGDRSYYVFRLRSLVANDHWSTQDMVYVDAQSGAVTSGQSE